MPVIVVVVECAWRDSPGGILPPCQPVFRPWLQPGGVEAPCQPVRRPWLLKPRGIPVLLNPRDIEPRDIDPCDIDMPPIIAPPPP